MYLHEGAKCKRAMLKVSHDLLFKLLKYLVLWTYRGCTFSGQTGDDDGSERLSVVATSTLRA